MSPVATGSDHVAAASLEVIWDRRAEWQRRLDMIAAARQFLYQSLFYLEYDEYGRAMMAALQQAQQRGVQVQLIIDTFGQRLGGVLMTRAQRRALAADVARLRGAGGRVTFYQPPRWIQRLLGAGHHVKIQVSEAGEALLCSGNVTRSSFEHWNECALVVRGDLAGRLLSDCRAIGGDVPDAHVAQVAGAHGPSTIPVDYWFCNPNNAQGVAGVFSGGWRNDVTDRMIEMVEAARQSLVITSFYFKPTEALMAAVVAAARRGVRVEVFHSHVDALPATDLAWIAAAVSFPRLLDAGVLIHERPQGEHSKIVLVDDAWVACGSYNFEDAAHDRLAEVMVATRDRATVEALRAVVGGLRSDPALVPVTPASLEALPARLRRRIGWWGWLKRFT